MKEIKKKRFLSSILNLASGSTLAQVISVISLPIITRLYDAYIIGVYTFIFTSISLFGPVINARFESAIISDEDDLNILSLMRIAFKIGFLLSVVVSLGYLVYFLCDSEYVDYSYNSVLIFVVLMLYSVQNILTAYNNRNKDYTLISQMYILRTGVQNVIQICLGFLKFGVLGLMTSHVLSQAAGIRRQSKGLGKSLYKIMKLGRVGRNDLLAKHSQLIKFTFPASFANTFSYSSINIAIELLFGATIGGLYSISYKILGLPLTIISGNISKIYFKEANDELLEKGSFKDTTKRILLFLIPVSIVMVLGMVFIVPPLLPIVLGEQWADAGLYVQILSFMFGVRFITSSVSTGLIIAKKQKVDFILQLFFVVSSITIFVLSRVLYFDILMFLRFISISYTLVYLLYLFFVIMYSRQSRNIQINKTN